MAIYVSIIDGMTNATDEDVAAFQTDYILQAGVVKRPQYTTPLAVSASGTPDQNSNVAAGVAYIPNSTSSPTQYFQMLVDAVETQAHSVTTANPRIDAVVLFIDLSATPDANASNVASIEIVEGAEAGSPTAPTDGDIDSALGAGTWIRLADVTIANPFVSISSGDISDQRATAYIDGSKVAVPSDTPFYFQNVAGDFDTYIYKDSSDDLVQIAPEGQAFIWSNGSSTHFYIDSDANIVATLAGWSSRVYDSTNTDYISLSHNGTYGFLTTNTATPIVVHNVNPANSEVMRFQYNSSETTHISVLAGTGGGGLFAENAAAGDGVNFWASTGSTVTLIAQATESGGIRPGTDNLYDLGTASFRWNDVYATNGTIQTSDVNSKRDILAEDLGLDFINALQPKTFLWKDETLVEKRLQLTNEAALREEYPGGDWPVDSEIWEDVVINTWEKTHSRRHHGLIAQDVEQTLAAFNVSTTDFAGFIEDENGKKGLRYPEFIASIIKAIQELDAKVEALG